jgi:predicted enzyme related to lactoylglutathione lyase
MTSVVENIAFDCADAYALAQWWSQVVGRPVSDDDKPGDPEASIALPGGTYLWFNQVPEPKTTKNRVHVCLSPEAPRDAEVERLLGLGATLVDDLRRPDGRGWAVLADPEGNEFCVLRPAAQRAASRAAGAAAPNAGAAPG